MFQRYRESWGRRHCAMNNAPMIGVATHGVQLSAGPHTFNPTHAPAFWALSDQWHTEPGALAVCHRKRHMPICGHRPAPASLRVTCPITSRLLSVLVSIAILSSSVLVVFLTNRLTFCARGAGVQKRACTGKAHARTVSLCNRAPARPRFKYCRQPRLAVRWGGNTRAGSQYSRHPPYRLQRR